MIRALTRDPEEVRAASAYGISRLSFMPIARRNAEADAVRAAHGLLPSAVFALFDALVYDRAERDSAPRRPPHKRGTSGEPCNKVIDAAARGSLNAKKILAKAPEIVKLAAASKRDPTHSAPRLPRPVPPWRYPATKEKKP